jgi:hypothetical protein
MATKKRKTVVRSGNTYVLTASGKKDLADVSGQGAIIRDTIARHQPITAAEITSRVGKALKTPNPGRTVSFYLCVWKGDGFVKFGAKKSK